MKSADWHLRAVALPDGIDSEDMWLTGRGRQAMPIKDAEELPGRFALPGMVDCHSHVSFAPGKEGPIPVDRRQAEENLKRYGQEGVGVVRDAGGIPEVVLGLPRVEGRPFVVSAGRHLAPAGRYFGQVHQPVEASDLVSVAMSELAMGARWVKLVADFQPAGAPSNVFNPEPTYEISAMRDLIEATHKAGARVAAHVTTDLVGDLVSAGIDSVEHGTALDKHTVEQMATRGTAWTPTLCAVLSAGPDAPPERRQRAAERRERLRELLPLAVKLRIPVLTGSDVVGSIAGELTLLIELGVDPIDALRSATTAAIRYLGTDVLSAPASIVTFDADPRTHPEVLSKPAAVVIGSVRVR